MTRARTEATAHVAARDRVATAIDVCGTRRARRTRSAGRQIAGAAEDRAQNVLLIRHHDLSCATYGGPAIRRGDGDRCAHNYRLSRGRGGLARPCETDT